MGLLIDGKEFVVDPYLTAGSSMQVLMPGAFSANQEGWTTLREAYNAREEVYPAIWARMVLASCPEQLRLLCAAYRNYGPDVNDNALYAMYAAVKAGMFIDLIRIVSDDDAEAKRAKNLFHHLYTGYVAGRTYQKVLNAV